MNQRCPKTGEPLAVSDLIAVNGGQATTPRTIGSCTVPGLLASLQAEWDSILLEQFTLRQQLADARHQASHNLYKQDAACRVIARLMKQQEKLSELARSAGADEAAISNITGKKTPSSQCDDESDDESGLPDDVCHALDHVTKASKERRKEQQDKGFDKVPFPFPLAVRRQLSSVSISSTGQKNSNGEHHTALMTCLAVPPTCSPECKLVFAGNSEGYIYGFDAMGGCAPQYALLAHTAAVRQVETKSDFVASCADDCTARIFRLDAGGQYRCVSVMKDHNAALSILHVLPTRRHLLTGSSDTTSSVLMAHDIEAGVALFKGNHCAPLAASALQPDGLACATLDTHGSLLLWSIKQMCVQHTFEAVKNVTGAAFADDGVTLGLCTASGVLQTWDIRQLRNPTNAVTTYDATDCGGLQCVAFDRTSRNIAAGTQTGVVKLWSTKEPQTPVCTLLLDHGAKPGDTAGSMHNAVHALAWGYCESSVEAPWLFAARGTQVLHCAVPE